VEVAQGEGDLSDEEAGLLLPEALDLHKVPEELPALDETHEEVDAELVLEDELHVYHEGMLHRVQDVLLQLDVLVLLIVDHDVLPDAFHRVNLPCELMLNQVDLPEGALAHHPQNHEVLQARPH
jgi:hypothetical protein